MLVNNLRAELIKSFVGNFKSIEVDFKKQIKNGLGFFPYGTGLLQEGQSKIPLNCILILGKEFGSTEYFDRIKNNGEKSEPTIKNLLKVIDTDLVDKVFLSNVFMGLIKDGKNLDVNREIKNPNYNNLCKEFLEYQINSINPLLIVTLGNIPNEFFKTRPGIRE